MKRYFIVLLMLLISLIGCTKEATINDSIEIVGDINRSINLIDVLDNFSNEKINYNNNQIYAIDLEIVIESLEPLSEEFDLYLISYDGFKVRIDGNSLTNTFLAYSEIDRWLYFSEFHPINSRVKNIKRIVIVRKEYDYQTGLNIIEEDNVVNYSVGQLYIKDYMNISNIEGQTTKTGEDTQYSIDVIKQRHLIPLNIVYEKSPEIVLVASLLGEYEYIYPENYFIEILHNKINLINIVSGKRINDIIGLLYNPPFTSNLDIFQYVKSFLSNDERVMVILVDGFSYYQYQDIVYSNDDFFMSSIENVKKSTTVYKPVTNAGLTAIITGVSPKESGVLNRSYREVNAETIFEMAKKMDKTSILIEGHTNILNIDVETILNFDRNNDGFNDDEIYQSALNNIEDVDLLFIHFHNVDDLGHSYGPFGEETISRLKVVDSYIEDLTANWQGKVMIVSDHGMHDLEDRGYHGDFLPDDIYVPLMILEGRSK